MPLLSDISIITVDTALKYTRPARHKSPAGEEMKVSYYRERMAVRKVNLMTGGRGRGTDTPRGHRPRGNVGKLQNLRLRLRAFSYLVRETPRLWNGDAVVCAL